jgi:predicted nucleic acid-binding protein
MRSQRIYIDTSVIGGCFDAEFATWSNGLFKDFRLGAYRPVVSEIVSAEIEDAPEPVRRKYAELLGLGAEVLEVNESILLLADTYQKRKILTPNFYDDGLHIALATAAEVDLLVSWNFKHIVHFEKIRLFSAVNLELGYKPLQIYSPREVTHYGNEGDEH